MLFFGCKMYQKEAWTYLQIIIFAFGLVQSSFEGVCIVAMRVSFGDLFAIHIFMKISRQVMLQTTNFK